MMPSSIGRSVITAGRCDTLLRNGRNNGSTNLRGDIHHSHKSTAAARQFALVEMEARLLDVIQLSPKANNRTRQ